MNLSKGQILSIALAIFSMFFGAGNLIYPLAVGTESGPYTPIAILAFILTAVLLPICGLVSMILFDGNYTNFFHRVGIIPGNVIIFICMLIIGPIIAIPRIVTLSHTMIGPFLPLEFLQTTTPFSSFIFAMFFLSITFLATFRENKIVEVLGNFIAPALLISLLAIIGKGIFSAQHITTPIGGTNAIDFFKINFMRGYETLDLLGGIFFSSFVITTLRQIIPNCTSKDLARIGFKSGLLGVSFLAIIYVGISILGMYHGTGFQHLHAGDLFRNLVFHVVGYYGTIIMAVAVLMACFSTAIALSAVVAEYLQNTICKGSISFVTALVIILSSTIPLSIFGLKAVLSLAGGPLVYIGYPVLITITLCNILHKIFNFNYIKIPTVAILIIASSMYFF